MAKSKEQQKEQQLKLLKQQEQHAKKMLELEKKRGEMNKEMSKAEMDMLEKEFAFQKMKMNTFNEMINVLAEKDRFDDFRSSSTKLFRQFEKFKSLFDEDRTKTKSILANGKSAKLDQPEKLYDASDALSSFSGSVRSLGMITDKEIPKDLGNHQDDLVDRSSNLKNMIDEIISEIENYLEGGDPENIEENIEVIKEQYESAEKLVQEMNKLVQKFNIPPSQRFEQTIIHQMKILSSVMPQIASNTFTPAIESKNATPIAAPEVSQVQAAQQAPVEDTEKDAETQKVEAKMKAMSDLMETVTNITMVLENQTDQELIKDMVSGMRDMFVYLTDLMEEDEEDAEMMQIRQLVQAIMIMTASP
ncbi:hypothetical protein CAEBREN_01507 [Caenorhabditis brenneri]|uniref:Uncharacterized protein n=1 Tax=Caenorhabditis brenneri TaxID=135651 RepID=G0NWD9_CAEBE|nr:hypothetical protein CAEBREN_01507 [Caenorhabditis brenneri]